MALVVEDERSIADLIRLYLERDGFDVRVEGDGRAGLAAARAAHPAVIVLDVRLPELDGMQMCRALRDDGDWTPVLFVTARDDEIDRVHGLELGADDYVTKPFSPRELVARVGAILRRSGRDEDADSVLRTGVVRLDPGQRRVWVGVAEVELTTTEFDLLAHLMRRPGRVFERDELLSQVWGYESAVGSRTVDVHVAQLRGKLGADSPIRTVRGVGYSVRKGT
ncbi:MAG: response regulator transcription factor [Streptosporangiales bacterium]|nr:response regulator transcription factor [Streptosporangiales bacterium]